MIITIEKVDKIKKCDQDGCKKIATTMVEYKNIFTKKFCLCKDCLNVFYKEIGKFVTPKSPKNIIIKKLKEENHE